MDYLYHRHSTQIDPASAAPALVAELPPRLPFTSQVRMSAKFRSGSRGQAQMRVAPVVNPIRIIEPTGSTPVDPTSIPTPPSAGDG